MNRNLGVLVSQNKLSHYLDNEQGGDFDLYHLYGSVLGLNVYFFSVNGIDFENNNIKGYSFGIGGRLVPKTIPIPKVIYNRSVHYKIADIRKIRKLRMGKETFLYNPVCTFDWESINSMLRSHPDLAGYLPKLMKCNGDLFTATSHFDRFLVWSAGSKRKGAIEIIRKDGKFLYQWHTKKRNVRGNLTKDSLRQELAELLEQDTFVIQESFESDKHEGDPYFIHVTIQKNGNGEWERSGQVGVIHDCKNMLQTSQMRSVKIQGDAHSINKLDEIAKKTALVLEKFIPHIADLGIDFTVSSTGRVYITDVSLYDIKKWYKEAGENSMWETTYQRPMEYGLFLLSQSIWGEKRDYSHLSI